MSKRVEVCVFSLEDAIMAAEAGADRLEVCVHYDLGGISMPEEDLKALAVRLRQMNYVNASGKLKVAVMCRPRGGDFCYSEDEFSFLTSYASTVAQLGFEALVCGLLKVENEQWVLDEAGISSLVAFCKENQMEFVFHRAFDELKEPFAALESLSLLGVNRVLSGWGQRDWPMFLRLIEQAKKLDMVFLPGGGIRSHNVSDYWSAGVDFVHSAAGSIIANRFALDVQEMNAILSSRK